MLKYKTLASYIDQNLFNGTDHGKFWNRVKYFFIIAKLTNQPTDQQLTKELTTNNKQTNKITN